MLESLVLGLLQKESTENSPEKLKVDFGIILFMYLFLMPIFFCTAAWADDPVYKGKTAEQWAELLVQSETEVHMAIFRELTRPDRSAGNILLIFLNQPNANYRNIGAMGLEYIAPSFPASISALTKAATDINLNVRYWALSALKKYGKEATSAIPAIIQALETLEETEPELEGPRRYYADARSLAAEALGAMGPAAKVAIPNLERSLQDTSSMVREASKQALEAIR